MAKIVIGLPTNRLIKPKTAQSLLELAANSKHELKIIVSVKGYNTAENRNYIAVQAVKQGCDYLFLCDDDMIYRPDTIDRLLAHGKDIVGGLYKTKYPEKQDYLIEYLDEEKEGLFECVALGGGLLLIKCDVFKKIPQPWFGYIWHDNGMVKESNDWFFCKKAREHRFKIWCDSTIQAKHIGLYGY